VAAVLIGFAGCNCISGPEPESVVRDSRPVAGSNLLSNPGFETGTRAPWEQWGTFSVVGGNAHTGAYAASVATSNGGGQFVEVTAGTEYTLRAWGKADGSGWTGINFKFFDAAWQWVGTEQVSGPFTATYGVRTISGVAPPGATRLQVGFYNSSDANLYLDDISVVAGAGSGGPGAGGADAGAAPGFGGSAESGADPASDSTAALARYPSLAFSDEFGGDLDIGMGPGTQWAPGWIAWHTRHLAGNSDKAWKQSDDELGWTAAWQSSGRTVGDALRSDTGFLAAHGSGPYNHEVSNGTLKMRAFRVPEGVRYSDFGGFPFTAGMISTEDRFSFLHGYMEMRLRFTRVGQGMHFALWTLSQDKKEWKADFGPEIDPLEVLYRDPNLGFERPSHWHQNAVGIPTQPGTTGYPFGYYNDVPTFDAWHTVGVERSQDDKIRFFFDGEMTREEDVSQRPQYRDERHYVLATWEIGGNWPGEVTSADPYWYVEVEVDYVRVFVPQ